MDYEVLFVFKVGHISQRIEELSAQPLTHRWRFYMDSWSPIFPLKGFVKKVTYYLHNTFRNPIQERTEPPYILEEAGFGNFQLKVGVEFFNRVEHFLYDLVLYDKKEIKSYQTICLQPRPDEWIPFTKHGGIVIKRLNNQQEISRILKAIRLTSDINCLHPFSFVTRTDLYANSNSNLKPFLEPLIRDEDLNGNPSRSNYSGHIEPISQVSNNMVPSNVFKQESVNLLPQSSSCESASSMADRLINHQGGSSQAPFKLKQKLQLLHEAQLLQQEKREQQIQHNYIEGELLPKERIVLKLSRKSVSSENITSPSMNLQNILNDDSSLSKIKKKKKKRKKDKQYKESLSPASSRQFTTSSSTADIDHSIYPHQFSNQMGFNESLLTGLPMPSSILLQDIQSPDLNFRPLLESPQEVVRVASSVLSRPAVCESLISPLSSIGSKFPASPSLTHSIPETALSPPIKDRSGIQLMNHLAVKPSASGSISTVNKPTMDLSVLQEPQSSLISFTEWPAPTGLFLESPTTKKSSKEEKRRLKKEAKAMTKKICPNKLQSSNENPLPELQTTGAISDEAEWLKKIMSQSRPPHETLISPLILPEASSSNQNIHFPISSHETSASKVETPSLSSAMSISSQKSKDSRPTGKIDISKNQPHPSDSESSCFEAANTALKTVISSLSEASSSEEESSDDLPKEPSSKYPKTNPPIPTKVSTVPSKTETPQKVSNNEEITASSLGLCSLSSSGSSSPNHVSSGGSVTPPMSQAATEAISHSITQTGSISSLGLAVRSSPQNPPESRSRYNSDNLQNIYDRITKNCNMENIKTLHLVGQLFQAASKVLDDEEDNDSISVHCLVDKGNNQLIAFDLEKLSDPYLDALSGILGLAPASFSKKRTAQTHDHSH